MAQSGYTPILIYASGTAAALPSAANLTSSANGAELALNYADGKLYYKNSSGVVTLLANAATAAGSPPGGSNTQVQYNNSGAFGGSANFVWDNSNVRLGIGTSSPNNTLAIYQATTPILQLGNSTTTVNAGSGLQMYITGLDSTIINQNGGYLRFGTSGSERMRIDSSGNVGIGTSSPSALGGGGLTLGTTSAGKNLIMYSSSDGNNGLVQFIDLNAANAFQINGNSANIGLYGYGSRPMIFYTNGTERMRISAAGGLSVGSTIDPGSGSILVPSNGTIFGNNSSNSRSYIELYNSSTGDMSIATTYTSAAIKFLTGGTTIPTERARISSTGGFSVGTTADPGAGAIYATGNITAYYSDARLKDVKGTIANALDKVSSLSGVYYTNNEVAVAHGYTSTETQVGLLAQDVEAVLPEVVKAAPFDLDERGDSKSGEHYKTVQYERIIPLLVEAIKELRAEVKALRG